MKHMKFLTFFFCIAFAVFACSSNNETDPNAGGIPDKEEPLATDFAKGADISWPVDIEHQRKIIENLRIIDDALAAHETELAEWQKKKKALMQLLLTGLVRVNA